MTTPRAVVVHRTTEYDELMARHGTRGQAAFFLATRERSLDDLEERHELGTGALAKVAAAIPGEWRRARVERGELARFAFAPEDVVIVVGQDGLVANVAKYLTGQPVIGINPLPGVNAGVLVPHVPDAAGDLMVAAAAGRAPLLDRTMVRATADDGQSLLALNEVFFGQSTHQSARYRISASGTWERQSSSGVIVGTGTGATGWCRSLQRIQAPALTLPVPDDPTLTWFVREPWPSPSTGADMVSGLVRDEPLTLDVESEQLVVFGDGVEADRLTLGWGQRLRIGRAPETMRTVV